MVYSMMLCISMKSNKHKRKQDICLPEVDSVSVIVYGCIYFLANYTASSEWLKKIDCIIQFLESFLCDM